MGMDLTYEDLRRIKQAIQAKYEKVASGPEGLFQYPTGRAGLTALGYDQQILDTLPESVLASYCGVGHVFSLGQPQKGESVLDIGCGAGVDTFIAAQMVGPTGRSVGVDFSPAMLDRAKANLTLTKLTNVSFHLASLESLPFPNHSFNLVISNGFFNLITDKAQTLAEVWRVLNPGGRLLLADQILVGPPPSSKEEAITSWFR